LFEEGMDHWYGNNFEQLNPQRGLAMVEAAAMLGSPMPIALCQYRGFNDNKGDLDDMRNAFKIFVELEKTEKTKHNPYHWLQWALGYVHRAGNVVPKSTKKAFDYYKSSAEQGNSNAMNTLGFFYIMGRGCEKDTTKAFEWYQKSAQLGCSSAMFNMGNRYIDGYGVTSNHGQAKEWWRKAAALGHTGAQTSLDALNLCD
jgi:TPR repeat protein